VSISIDTVTGVPRGVLLVTRGVTVTWAFVSFRDLSTSWARAIAWLSVAVLELAIRADSYAAILRDCFVKIAFDASIIPMTSVTATGRQIASSTVATPNRRGEDCFLAFPSVLSNALISSSLLCLRRVISHLLKSCLFRDASSSQPYVDHS
jgi:hypothetical protein